MASCDLHLSGRDGEPQEDTVAKRLLQGVWRNSDDDAPFFQIVGDSVFYPDTTAMPLSFQIIKDTFYIHASTLQAYPILKQTANRFVVQNQYGEPLKLYKSTEPFDSVYFSHSAPAVLHQRELIRRDTVISYDNARYHIYVQVNPTTYRVVNTTYAEGGIAIDNVYYENILNIHIFQGTRKLFSSDFLKSHFSGLVPDDVLKKSVLSDILYQKVDGEGFHFIAYLVIPPSSINYTADILVNHEGQIKIR